jgi:hypothetical protein
MLDRLVVGLREGRSQVLVLRGEAGIGKTVLLDYLAGGGSDCRVIRMAGIESEMELAYAGLHQLCGSLLGRLEQLPAPQRDALGVAFGLQAGPAPDRFMVGLAVLGLLSDAAEQQPTLCLVDDAQWLDQASAETLAFVARRALVERIALVFAVRDGSDARALNGLPEFAAGALAEETTRVAWKDLPTWAAVGTADLAAGSDVVRSMAQRADATITEIEGSHVIMISQPDAVTQVILTARDAVS